ncbi:MAG TPA: SigE family RNA polymerase sigma factor [Acidothermaceae bacterium]|nr:SigE family RNA polymerase sigma factor [Acidothermaceae bacterium]
MNAEDEADFRSFATSRMRDLRRTAYLLCGDWHHADDVTQTVLTKLYSNWTKIQERERVDAYVRTMLVRATFERKRRFWWRRELSSAQPPETPVDIETHVEERLVLLDALAKMPPRQRAVLVLRFWEDQDVAETANALGCTEGTVKSQTARGLTALRALLADSHLMEGRSS